MAKTIKTCSVCGGNDTKDWIVIPVDEDGGHFYPTKGGELLSLEGHVCKCGMGSYYDGLGYLHTATWTDDPLGNGGSVGGIERKDLT
jgi:hypothetical protein